MQAVPLQAIPNQTLQAQLAGQACSLHVYQLAYGLFIDVSVSNALVVAGVICLNENRIVRDAYLGFDGDLAFYDTQGSDDPVYTGLGARWVLLYLDESDLPDGEG